MNPQLPSPQLALHPDTSDFQEFWRTVSRYRGRIIGVTLVFAMLGALAAWSEEPRYLASVNILIEARLDRPIDRFQEVYDPGVGRVEYYTTQAQLLKTREILGRLVDRLDLTTSPDILPPVPEKSLARKLTDLDWLKWLPMLPIPESEPPREIPAAMKRELAIDVLQGRISTGNLNQTQLIAARVESGSPPLAASIANTLGDLFVESGLESRLDATERTTRWLNQRLSDIRTKLEESEAALQAFRERNQLVSVGGTRSLYEEELLDNSRKLRDAQRKKAELASAYWKIQQAGGDDRKLQEISTLLLDPVVSRASDNLAQAEQAVKQLQERYGEKHPQMTSAQARLAAAARAYYEQLRLAANGIKAEYEIASETERALTEIVETGKARIRRLDQSDYELRSLEREVQTNRELYNIFLKRFKETDVTGTFEPVNARVVDRATVPRVPYKPDKPKIIALWTLGGLFLGVCLVALRHLLSETVRSPDQLEESTQLPVISVLPRMSGKLRRSSLPVSCINQPRAPFSEGVRSIRASVQLNDVDHRMKRILFTSALPKEGKSSLAAGFAVTMGQMEKVLLVEADLRAPTQKKIFGIDKSAPGLVEVLTGQAKLEDAIFTHDASGIDVLPVNQIPANPAEVVASAAFQKLAEALATRYDRVVFDSPPCHAASDSILMANRMDAVIFVIHAGKTSLRAIHLAIKHLRAAQAPLLGHVLNMVDARTAYGYGGLYYGYGHYGT